MIPSSCSTCGENITVKRLGICPPSELLSRTRICRPPSMIGWEKSSTSSRSEVMEILRRINRDGTTVVMVTHSPEHARQASRVVRMLDGRVVEDELLAVAA